jgi:ADP-heptose:LPS heptosyltransferase
MLLYLINKRFPFLLSLIQGLSDVFLRILRSVAPRKFTSGNVAIICLHKIGDSIFTFPAVKDLLSHYKKAHIITYTENVAVYKLAFPDADFITLNKNDFSLSGRLAGKSSREKIKKLSPEIIVDLTGSILSAGLIFNSGAIRIMGISEKIYRKLYDNFVPVSYVSHLSEIYLNVVREIGIPASEQPHNVFENSGSHVSFLLFPSAGWPSKEWSLNKFILLARMLKNDYPVKLIFQQGSLKNDIKDELTALGLDYTETAAITDMIEEIQKHSDVICNDSGPSHLAEILGKRTFTIFGPTNPKVHKKSSVNNFIIYDPARCSPGGLDKLCFANGGRDCPSSECLRRLSVQKVYGSIIIQ